MATYRDLVLPDGSAPPDGPGAFLLLAQSLAPRILTRVDDFDELVTFDPDEWESMLVTVDEGDVLMQALDGSWVQRGTGRFSSAAARDSAYAKASGAYLVSHAQALLLDTGIEYRYTGSAWLPAVSEMVLQSGTFTTASSVILDNIGSTAFRDIIIELDVSAASASHTLSANLRSAGSTDTSSVYDRQLLFGADSTTTSFKASNATEWGIGATASRNIRRVTISLSRLADAVATLGRIEYEEFDATTGAAEVTTGIRHKTASAFDGIVIAPSSGTITGTYTVRGKVR